MKQFIMNLMICGWHYFYAHLIQEPSLIHYRIAWLIPIMELHRKQITQAHL